MPERTVVLITALILERPACVACLSTKSGIAPELIDQAITTISRTLMIHRAYEPCWVCGDRKAVLSVLRP